MENHISAVAPMERSYSSKSHVGGYELLAVNTLPGRDESYLKRHIQYFDSTAQGTPRVSLHLVPGRWSVLRCAPIRMLVFS